MRFEKCCTFINDSLVSHPVPMPGDSFVVAVNRLFLVIICSCMVLYMTTNLCIVGSNLHRCRCSSSPEVACWTSDHWVTSFNPLEGHVLSLISPHCPMPLLGNV